MRGWRGSPRNEDLASLAKFDKFNAYANMQLLMSFHAQVLSTHCTDFSNNNKFLRAGESQFFLPTLILHARLTLGIQHRSLEFRSTGKEKSLVPYALRFPEKLGIYSIFR